MSATFQDRTNLLGFGLVRPLRRLGGDFSTAAGEDLIRAGLQQILGTRPGELPWRPRFGANLDRSRNRNMEDEFLELAKRIVEEAIRTFEPRAEILSIIVESEETTMKIRLEWAVLNRTSPTNQVIIGPVTQEVTI